MGMPGMTGGQGAPPATGGQAQGAAMMMAQRGAGGGQRGGGITGASAAAGTGGEQAQSYDRQILQWMDKEKIDGFVAWTKVKHPDLGEVEVGGFKPYAAINPPAARIAELGKPQAEFALYLTSIFPKVGIAKFEAVNQGGGLFRVKAEVENSGFLPTALGQAVTARAVKATKVQLQVAPESIISGSSKTNSVQSLAGSGDRVKFDWLIRAKAGDTIELLVVSQKAGSDKRSVVLK
jgi:hypothetical protein